MSERVRFQYTPVRRWVQGSSYFVQFQDGRRVRTIGAMPMPSPILWLMNLFTGRRDVFYELVIVERRYSDKRGWEDAGIPYEPRLDIEMDMAWFFRKWRELDPVEVLP